MRCRWMRGRGETDLEGCLSAWSRPNAEPGQGAGQVPAGPKPPEERHLALLLAWRRIDDRSANRTGVEVLSDLPELLGHGVGDRVSGAEGGRRWRDAQLRGHGGQPT